MVLAGELPHVIADLGHNGSSGGGFDSRDRLQIVRLDLERLEVLQDSLIELGNHPSAPQ